jgi:hypothetical protein
MGDQDFLFSEVIEKLRAAARADRQVDAAQVHLINLQDIIRNAGPHWQKIKDRIRAGSLTFLRGCLGDDDIVIPCGDGFLVIYAQGDNAALAERSVEMQGLLTEYYCGQEGLSALQVEVEHKQVDSNSFGDLMVSARDASQASLPPEPPAPVFAFQPIWSPRARLIATYCATPLLGEPSNLRAGYEDIYRDEGHHERRAFLELDLQILDAALEQLTRYGGAEPRPAIGACVHASTIQNRSARTVYLESLKRVPPSLARHFFVKVAEIERGAPLVTIADWTGMLRPRVSRVLLEFHHSDPAVHAADQTGAWGAGFFLPNRYSDETDLEPVLRHLRNWGRMLSQKRMRFFVDNLRNESLLAAAADAGAHFVTSQTHWPAVAEPGGVVVAHGPEQGNIPASQGMR